MLIIKMLVKFKFVLSRTSSEESFHNFFFPEMKHLLQPLCFKWHTATVANKKKTILEMFFFKHIKKKKNLHFQNKFYNLSASVHLTQLTKFIIKSRVTSLSSFLFCHRFNWSRSCQG